MNWCVRSGPLAVGLKKTDNYKLVINFFFFQSDLVSLVPLSGSICLFASHAEAFAAICNFVKQTVTDVPADYGKFQDP